MLVLALHDVVIAYHILELLHQLPDLRGSQFNLLVQGLDLNILRLQLGEQEQDSLCLVRPFIFGVVKLRFELSNSSLELLHVVCGICRQTKIVWDWVS